MATSRNKKTIILDRLGKVKEQKSVLLFTTKESKATLNAKKNYQLRSNARRASPSVVIELVKNTLLSKVFNFPKPTGQTYISYLADPKESNEVIVPKVMVEVLNNFKEETSVIGSIINGEFYDKNRTLILAKTPTLQESMSMLAGMLKNEFAAKIARSVKELPASIARGVKAAKKVDA